MTDEFGVEVGNTPTKRRGTTTYAYVQADGTRRTVTETSVMLRKTLRS